MDGYISYKALDQLFSLSAHLYNRGDTIYLMRLLGKLRKITCKLLRTSWHKCILYKF